MPTSYTHDLRADSSFADFARRCAREFGAAIDQRDEPLSAPLREPEPPDYYPAKVAEAEAEAQLLLALTPAQAADECAQANTKAADRYQAQLDKMRTTGNAYRAMLARVEAWHPPTPDHQALKGFMRDQLSESLRFDCRNDPKKPTLQTPDQWRQTRLAAVRKDLAYYTEQAHAEQQRHAERVAWIRALNASLG